MATDLTADDLKLIAEAKQAGAQTLTDAQTFAHSIILHVSTDLVTALPLVAADAQDHLFSFIPANDRGFVGNIFATLTNGMTQPLENSVKSRIISVVGAALNRIDAAIGAADVDLGVSTPAASGTATAKTS